jgi:hypothetical protein
LILEDLRGAERAGISEILADVEADDALRGATRSDDLLESRARFLERLGSTRRLEPNDDHHLLHGSD